MQIFFDPSFRNWGWVYWDGGIKDAGVITTSESKGFAGDIEACKQLDCELKKVLSVKHDLVIAESPVGSQSSRAAVGIGVVIALLSQIENLETITPFYIKKRWGFKEKSDSLALFVKKFPNYSWIKGKWGNLPYSEKNSHIADALAAGLLYIHKSCNSISSMVF